jgi:hypothetical protein
VNRFIVHLQVVTTNNYNTIADFHTTIFPVSSQQWLFLCNVFTRRFLVTNPNNEDSSAFVLTSFCPVNIPLLNWSNNAFKITPRHGSRRKHSHSIVEACLPSHCIATVTAQTTQKTPLSIVACVYVAGVTWQRPLFTESLRSNGSTRHSTISIFRVYIIPAMKMEVVNSSETLLHIYQNYTALHPRRLYSEEWIKKKNILSLGITGCRELEAMSDVSYATGWPLVVMYLSQ